MSRRSKKGPFIEERLLARIKSMNDSGSKQMIRTWSRSSTVFPQMVGHTVAVHDGRKHVPVFISEQMVGHKPASSRRRVTSVVTPATRRHR